MFTMLHLLVEACDPEIQAMTAVKQAAQALRKRFVFRSRRLRACARDRQGEQCALCRGKFSSMDGHPGESPSHNMRESCGDAKRFAGGSERDGGWNPMLCCIAISRVIPRLDKQTHCLVIGPPYVNARATHFIWLQISEATDKS